MMRTDDLSSIVEVNRDQGSVLQTALSERVHTYSSSTT